MRVKYLWFVFTLIFIDQLVKYLVHVNMPIHSEIRIIGDFFKLYHIENPGMAFGINFDYKYSKLILSIFRLFASVLIGVYLLNIIDKNKKSILIISISLIFAGAIGNVIDSVFYGLIYNNAPLNAPFSLFNGQVIDMFYIDIWEGYLHDSIPFLGGTYLSLWPVFNFADSFIFVGVSILFIFQNKLKNEY